jgi:predicted amidohydrolase/AraC-like DNA-binding protein
MKIALTQMDLIWENKEANLDKGEALIVQAAKAGAEMIVFPEMSFTGFSMNVEQIGEVCSLNWAGQDVCPTAFRMLEISSRYGIAIVFGYVQKFISPTGRLIGKNCLMCVADGKILAKYEKLHPFTFGEERQHYGRGDRLSLCHYRGITFGFFICYDLRFPEIFQLVSRQAEACVVIANWPKERASDWELLLQARALENQAYVLGVNRIGEGGGLMYLPGSMMFDPYGKRVFSQNNGELCLVELDPAAAKRYRREFPVKQDRREAFYSLQYGMRDNWESDQAVDTLRFQGTAGLSDWWNSSVEKLLLEKILSGKLSETELAVLFPLLNTGEGDNRGPFQVVICESYARGAQRLSYSLVELLKATGRGLQKVAFLKEGNREIILLKGAKLHDRFRRFLEQYQKEPEKDSPLDSIFIALGNKMENFQDIPISYETAIRQMNRRFFCSPGQHILAAAQTNSRTFAAEGESTIATGGAVDKITNCILLYNRKKCKQELHAIESFFATGQSEESDVKLFLIDLVLSIKEKINRLYGSERITLPSNSEIIQIIQEKAFLFEIMDLLEDKFEHVMKTIGNPSRENVMEDITAYIDRNFQDNLKLETISSLFGYNSTYLGKVFKELTGVNFNTYLDQKRIAYAQKLLLENQLKVYEIAARAGFHNLDYFHKKFKNQVGISPAQYRNEALHQT